MLVRLALVRPCALVAVALAGRALAQSTDTLRSTERPSAHGTIVLFASASARAVRFASPPRIVVRLNGAVSDSVHVIARRNLPERVQPGVTYRDVYIAVEIIGHLNAQCLARAIGAADSTSQSRDCPALTLRDSAGAAAPRRPPP